MNTPLPACREVDVIAFRGDHAKNFAATIMAALNDERRGLGPGPSRLDLALFLGHAAVSIDGGQTHYGFLPETGGLPAWFVIDELDGGKAFPGTVRDDTAVFAAAQGRGLRIQNMKIILPDPAYQTFVTTLDAERLQSQYSYGYPDGDGDCNCVTWLERLGLPLLTGYLNELERLLFHRPVRSSWRFGRCV